MRTGSSVDLVPQSTEVAIVDEPSRPLCFVAAFPRSNAVGGSPSHTGVRVFAVAVAGSLVAHVVALVVLSRDPDDDPDPIAIAVTEPAPPSPPPAPIDPPPLEVVLLDHASNDVGPAVVASIQTGSTAVVPGKRGRGRNTGSESPGTPGSPGTTRSKYMTMRDPNQRDMNGVSGDFLADFLNRSKPLPPPPDIPGERVGDEIADLRAKLKRADRYSPEEQASMRAQLVGLAEERDGEELKSAGGGTYKTEKQTFRAKVNPDGSVKLEDKPENMDSQDKFMLDHGVDPYARNKIAYLDRTRDQRVAIGKRYRSEQLKKSVVYMQQHIARLFASTTDVQKRKEGLFELWDECAETGDPEVIAGGEAARAFVMSYVRGKLPFTPDEIRAFNARRQSKQPFAP